MLNRSLTKHFRDKTPTFRAVIHCNDEFSALDKCLFTADYVGVVQGQQYLQHLTHLEQVFQNIIMLSSSKGFDELHHERL